MLHPKFANEYCELMHKFELVHTTNVLYLFNIERQETSRIG